MHDGNGRIDKLDFPSRSEQQPLLHDGEAPSSSRLPSRASSHAGRFFEHVVEGIQERDRAQMKREVTRYVSFAWAIVNW